MATARIEGAELPQNIIQIIPLIREELGPIAKSQAPTSGPRYQYRSADQIIDAIVPLFNKYGVFTTVEDQSLHYDTVTSGSKFITRALISEKVTFYGPDGSNVSTTVVAESQDYSDKATGAAGTYAYRFALTKTFTIPTGIPDPDSRYEEFENKSSGAPAASAPAPKPAANDLVGLKNAVKAYAGSPYGATLKEVLESGTEYLKKQGKVKSQSEWTDNAVLLQSVIDFFGTGEAV